MIYKPQTTTVFKKNLEAYEDPNIRFIVNQGGSRSSKTYSIAQLFGGIMFGEVGKVLTVVRKTLPSLKASAMRDFFAILKEQDVYNEGYHNKTENTYIYPYAESEIEFISVDEPQKIRGRKRDDLWVNEANELSYEDFRQLNMRTTGKVFLDYNPSDEFHWIYDYILTRQETAFIQSTYLDNPFLEESVIKEIELLKATDLNYWKIYGLGERGVNEATIYNHWQFEEQRPEFDETIYGLDFGFNNQSALVRVGIKDQEYYTEELLYESHLTNSQLIDKIKDIIKDENYIYADCAEPQRIEEIKQAGFNIFPADKDVKKGIDDIRSHKIYISKGSINLLKEIKSYKWKVDKDGRSLDEPVKINDHLMDATRYAIHTHGMVLEPNITMI